VSRDGGSGRARASKAPVRRGYESLEMPESVFKLYQGFIQRGAGIYLAEHKQALLVRRLRARVRSLDLDSFLDYYRLFTRAGNDAERQVLFDLVSTNETRFFREPRQLEILEQALLPAFRSAVVPRLRPKRVRAWCAACSSGEEPFTLAMILARHLTAAWRREVLATDISTRVLERARQAKWPIRQIDDIPKSYFEEFMVRGRGPQGETIEARSSLRAMVRFERLNLHLDPPPRGPFDLILCRNVLMYFDQAAKRGVVDRLLSVLADDGYLLVGHAESLSGLDPRLRLVAPTIYARADRGDTGLDDHLLFGSPAAGRRRAAAHGPEADS
jgi:chemotaxis protein methyltransferase CheR